MNHQRIAEPKTTTIFINETTVKRIDIENYEYKSLKNGTKY